MNKNDYDSYSVTKYIRISPYKLRKVANEIRGLNVDYALKLLKVMNQRGSFIIYKSLYSAYNNAINKKINPQDLVVSSIMVGEAGILKRMQPRARGRSFSIKKRLSHLQIGLNSQLKEK